MIKQVTASLDEKLANDLDCLRRATLNAPVAGIVRLALREFIDRTVRENEGIGARYLAEKNARAVKHLRVIK